MGTVHRNLFRDDEFKARSEMKKQAIQNGDAAKMDVDENDSEVKEDVLAATKKLR